MYTTYNMESLMQYLAGGAQAGDHGGLAAWIIYCATTIAAMVIGWVVITKMREYVVGPALVGRTLRQQGFRVLPRTPIVGDLPRLKRLEKEAQSCPLPSPSHHHLLFPYLFPFHHQHLQARGESFVFWVGNQPTLVVNNPDDVKSVMAVDVKLLQKTEMATKHLHQLFGKGILLADGDDWHNQRHILQPAFFADKLKRMVTDMNTSGLEMVNKWDKKVSHQSGNRIEIEVAKDIKDVTADILAHTSFGLSYLKGRSVFDKQVELLQLLSELQVKHTIPGYRYLPTNDNRKCKELERSMYHELLEIVRLRHESIKKEGGAKHSYGNDLLGLMLAAEDEEVKKGNTKAHLTTQQVIDECKNFFFAGHETTANLLAWTLVLLSLNKDWQEKAREEVFQICGKEGEPNADQLNKLKIVGMVLNESLRLYPPVPEFGRREVRSQVKAVKVGDKTIPNGVAVEMASLYIHRDKRIWGEDADEFKPERFVNGVGKACNHPYAFMPFGHGPRICIGQHFALEEAKIIMSLILQRFRFDLSPNYKHAPTYAITVRPKHGVPLILEKLP